MVCNSQDLYFLTGDCLNNRIGEMPHDEATFSMMPKRSQYRMLHQQLDRALEFGKKCLRKSGASAFLIVFGRFPEITFSLRV